MSVKNKAQIEAYIGASGSGKGVSINQRLAREKPSRLLIWDPRDEYQLAAKKCTSLTELASLWVAAKNGGLKVRFVPGAKHDTKAAFDLVCKLAFRAGNLLFLVEELSDVTTPTHAPASWRQCITQGRHRALHVIGAAQRPALIDKTFLGNATYIRCFVLRYRPDRVAMAHALDVDESAVTGLQTVENADKGTTTINYLERDFQRGLLRGGCITLRR
jgi:hypothetical protein